MVYEEGEIQDFPSKPLCLTVPKIFVGERFCAVFQEVSSSQKVFGLTGGVDYQEIPLKIFCLTLSKNSARESFTVALISDIEKVWIRGGVSRFCVPVFLSHSSEFFRGGNPLLLHRFRVPKEFG